MGISPVIVAVASSAEDLEAVSVHFSSRPLFANPASTERL
jgi:hypothetical protein